MNVVLLPLPWDYQLFQPMKIRAFILSILIFQCILLSGQFLMETGIDDAYPPELQPETDTAFEKKINNEPNLIFELKVANDMTFFTDQYFSSGVDIKVYAPFFDKSPFNKILLPNPKDALNYYALTAVHNLYTPIYYDTISHREIDHPFAAYLLFGIRKESFSEAKRLKVTSELQLGLIGPAAGGEVFQNTLHEYIPIAGHVAGWENQIGNDICVQYSAMLEKGLVNFNCFELNATGGVKIGIPHSEVGMGMYFRGGYFDDYFSHIGFSRKNALQIWLFCAGDINFVAYNAVLDGGLFSHQNSYALQTINHYLLHSRFGGTLAYKTMKFEIAQEVNSPSFPSALWHRWAYISLMLGF